MSYAKQLETIQTARQKLDLKLMRTIEKAVKSDDPNDILAGSSAMSKIVPAQEQHPKAFLIDPLQFNANLGYKDKPFSLTYTTLLRMSKTPIINSIIKTRKNQVADFAEPQADRYSTGFVIRKKKRNGVDADMSEKDKKVANALTDFIMNCGKQASWTDDDFDSFIRKIVEDSLVYDQMTFEIIRNRRGQVESFMATDGATFRFAESAFRRDAENSFFENRGSRNMWVNNSLQSSGKKVNGYLPQFVQVYQNAVVNEFYPWELCFGVRNPSTNIMSNGYGCSELEELINIVTSMLWGDEYNRRFFSQGSAPKGLLRVKGQVNEAAFQQFKQQWQAMISGVYQSWKTPVVQADVDWIDLQKSNRDMEYSAWMEYLIKQACAIYCIDPSEIGWDISRGQNGGGLFEGSQAERLQNSKDKGLYPILKFIQRKINKYIIEQINPDFEFVFIGLDGLTVEDELDMDIKKLNAFATINEIRQKWDLPDLEDGGDVIENSVWYQNHAASQQQQGGMGGFPGMGGEEGDGDEDGEYNPFEDIDPEYMDAEEGEGDEEETSENNPFDDYDEEDNDEEDETEEDDEEKSEGNNIFVKAFESFMAQENL